MAGLRFNQIGFDQTRKCVVVCMHWFQTRQTEDQWHSDTSPWGECSLLKPTNKIKDDWEKVIAPIDAGNERTTTSMVYKVNFCSLVCHRQLCKKLAQSWCTASVDVAVVVADRQNGWTDQRQKVQHNFLLLSYLPYCYMLTKATVFSYLPTFLPTDRPTFPIVICWGMQQCSPTFLPTYLLLYVEPGCGVRLPTYLLPLLLYVEEGYSSLFLINIIQSNWIISMLELYLLYTSTRQQYYWACVGKASHLHIVQHL